ncbi:glycoside hydrolase family 2 protein [Flindersiella endophytica]
MGEWRDLHAGWVLRAVGDTSEVPQAVADALAAGKVAGTVPGCVHTDLLAAGLIPDPYLDRNEYDLRWIGRTDWAYATSFVWKPGSADRTDVVCEGLDTIATLELNGQPVGSTQNMHRSYRFNVSDSLREGLNELVITFASPERYAGEQRDRLGDLPGPNSATPEPFNFIRKMACNFGWDWGPVLVTSGIWKPIYLHSWKQARLAQVRPHVSVDEGVGYVRVDADLDHHDDNRPLTLATRIGDRTTTTTVDVVPGDASVSFELEVPNPRLWWPYSLGDQPRYDLEVTLLSAEGTVVDRWTRKIGFREIRLDTTPDQYGSEFTIVVNGVPIFARGANWIPDDCFPSRVTAKRYRERLLQAKGANIDLLRIWGGGIYEKDEFYDACDELGILVWQDFLFACAAYPEEEPFGSEVEAEARENVARLMPHPSLALWNGNNENIWGSMEWGWADRIAGRTWGEGFYFDLLPRVVAEIDPGRPYWPGSPYAGSRDLPVNADNFGCSHIWDVWNQRDYFFYRSYVPRFVAEFGFQGPPTWATLTRAVHDEPLAADSEGVLSHQKATGGNEKLARGLAPHFPEPVTVEDWHWLTQLNQARALQLGISHFRSYRGRCMGTVVWQLNDCWPVTSWAAVDGDARLKPLWYALRDVYDSRLLSVQPRGAALVVSAVNDRSDAWDAPLVVERRTFSGQVLARWHGVLKAGARDARAFEIAADVATPGDPAAELLVVTAGDRRAFWFFRNDKDLAYPVPAYDVTVTKSGDGHRVLVTAKTLLRDLSLFADRLDPAGSVDTMLVTLLPGESHTFAVRGVAELSAADLVAPVLRTAGDVRAGVPAGERAEVGTAG